MLPDIENLLKLQDTDKEIRRLQDEVAELPKRVAVIEQKLAGTKAELEKAQAAVKADEAARRKYDTAINDLREKISKYRDQSLDVKTNEQYKALLHEIQFAEKEIATNEDKILELMVNADARDKEVKAAQAELKAETAEIEKEKAEGPPRYRRRTRSFCPNGATSVISSAPASTKTCSATTSASRNSAAAASPKSAIKNAWPAASCFARRPITKSAPASRPSSATPASASSISIR